MAVPAFEQMLRPILALAAENQVTRQSATNAMVDHFGLSAEDRAAKIPSGMTHVLNRASWAMTFLTKAGLISKVAPKSYHATEFGREFLSRHREGIKVKDLRAIPGWEEAWQTSDRATRIEVIEDGENSIATPIEAIDRAVETLNLDLRSRLLDAILAQSPSFFEELVLDVLLAMGYGGSREDAAKHLGKSGDEGIDGRINQDALGLDQIMVQAKRYSKDQAIDRKTIQAFIGSLAGQGVTKGVFITTSRFAETAREFVQRGSNTKIVLIDGDGLLDLMMRHHIGVRVEREIELLAVDQNYFEESE
jgi:restriction system protein